LQLCFPKPTRNRDKDEGGRQEGGRRERGMMIDIQVIASEVIMVACHSRAGMPIEYFEKGGGVGSAGIKR